MSTYTPEELALLKEDGMDVDAVSGKGGALPPPPPPGQAGGATGRQRSDSSATAADDNILPRVYYNVCAACAAAHPVRTLGGGTAKSGLSATGSFVIPNDNRILRANRRHCYGKKCNISASFN
jgi:hypothetical protein